MQKVSRLCCFAKASKEIVKWIESGKDALLVAGARQVGKTYLIRELLEERGALDLGSLSPASKV